MAGERGAAAGQRDPQDRVGVFRLGGARPPTAVIVDYIDEGRSALRVDQAVQQVGLPPATSSSTATGGSAAGGASAPARSGSRAPARPGGGRTVGGSPPRPFRHELPSRPTLRTSPPDRDRDPLLGWRWARPPGETGPRASSPGDCAGDLRRWRRAPAGRGALGCGWSGGAGLAAHHARGRRGRRRRGLARRDRRMADDRRGSRPGEGHLPVLGHQWGPAWLRARPAPPLIPAGRRLPPARERRRELGVPDDAERARLAARFGPVLRAERGHLTQQQLADAAGLDRKTVVRLETGRQRPTTASIWKLARALRGDLRSRVALDDRLRMAAGDSLRDYGRRPHTARERMRLALRLEAGDGLVGARKSSHVMRPADTRGRARRGGRVVGSCEARLLHDGGVVVREQPAPGCGAAGDRCSGVRTRAARLRRVVGR